MLVSLVLAILILIPLDYLIFYKISEREGKNFKEKLEKIECKNLIILNLGYIFLVEFCSYFLKNRIEILLFTIIIFYVILKFLIANKKKIIQDMNEILEKYFMIAFIIISIMKTIINLKK